MMTPAEAKAWLTAFIDDRSLAWVRVPHAIYTYLRENRYLDTEHDVTELGQAFLQEPH